MILNLVLILVLELGFNIAQVTDEEARFQFNKKYVGVAFSPYIKNWVDGKTPDWSSYKLSEVKEMVRVVSNRFKVAYTFGMGVDLKGLNKPWNETQGNCLIPLAAAQWNKENGRNLLKVYQGMYQNPDPKIWRKEVDNAFEAAEYANQLFPKTVIGLIFTSQSIVREVKPTVDLVHELQIRKQRAHDLNLKIGVRIYNCHDILPSPENSEENKLQLEKVIAELDFVTCPMFPGTIHVEAGPINAVQMLGEEYMKIREAFQSVNPNINVVLGDTGWASLGKTASATETENTIQNMYIYWTEFSKWATENRIHLQMFEAIDEPWKSNWAITDPNQPNGRFGGEGHLGWWKLADNNNEKSLIEKILEPQQAFDTDKSSSVGLIVGILVPLFVIVAVIIVYLMYRLKIAKKTIDRLTEAEIEEFVEGSKAPKSGNDETYVEENANNLPYNREYELAKEKICIEKEVILGQGEFGMVFKGKIILDEGDFEDVAFKTTKQNQSVQHLKNLLSELKLMIYIGKHPNVIKILGAYTEEIRKGVVYIATEFCGKGSLESLLRKKLYFVEDDPIMMQKNVNSYANITVNNPPTAEFVKEKEPIKRSQMNSWAFQIAQGMKYLANKKVIHSDLATRNILVANDNTVRITDFGLSRRLYEYTSYVKASQEPLPWRWMAFESLRSLSFSPQSDVWSFGVTLWEIYSMGDIPYPGLSWDISFVQQLDQGLRMPAPKYALDEVYKKMLECWELDPLKRPTFAELEEYFAQFNH